MQTRLLRTRDDVRGAVERQLRRPISDAAWAFVQDRDDDAVGDVLTHPDDASGFESLVASVRRFERYAAGPGAAGAPIAVASEREPVRVANVDPGVAAHNRLAVLEARQLPAVAAFRREVLRGRLLALEAVAGWVERRARKSGHAGAVELLSYPVVRTVGGRKALAASTRPVRVGSVADRLRRVAVELVAAYGWSEASAVALVLADGEPSATVAKRGVRHGQTWLTARVLIEAHPSLTGRQVAALYEELRREWFGAPRGHVRGKGTVRRSWPQLAAFVAGLNDGRTWREAMEAWNAGPARGRPRWRYPDHRVGTFLRDASAAYQRLTGEPIAWKSAAQRVTKSNAARRAHKLHTIARPPTLRRS